MAAATRQQAVSYQLVALCLGYGSDFLSRPWKIYEMGDEKVRAVRTDLEISKGEMVAIGSIRLRKNNSIEHPIRIDEPSAGRVMVSGKPLFELATMRGRIYGEKWGSYSKIPPTR